ncbi:MAG TPA: TonB-dependent receptor plug domain-containing protein, partial [Opitutaceae bacterium]|nr:TonB-dependent receptor plug domain-containing protein [Opitutaceae bacterium]
MTIIPSVRSGVASPPKCGLISAVLQGGTGLLAAFSLAGFVHAQTSAPASPSSDQPVTMERFVVEGYTQSLAASLDSKRQANAIVDVITAEDVGKFPDTNVAESLSHIPGVTVDRLFGQGERVSILGTDPNLNRTLLNGQTVASGDWFILDQPSRQFNYTLLAPEVIGKAEVYKTPEARLPEGSIGGTVILSTRSPLAGRPFAFSGSISDMYNDRDKHHDGNASQVISWHNKAGTLGILLGLQSSREHIRRDGVEALGTTTA